MNIKPLKEFRKIVYLPTDKSIMQRALIIGAAFDGITIENPTFCNDTISTLNCIQALGAEIGYEGTVFYVKSKGLKGGTEISAGNSATAMRLLLGAAAGLSVRVTINGDESLIKRSMEDAVEVLTAMGAEIRHNDFHAPLVNIPSNLNGIDFTPVAPSAQVKSAVLLAGLNAFGTTRIYEKVRTRDHTERLLAYLGAEISYKMERGKEWLYINPGKLENRHLRIPGDMSSAAYAVATALLIDNGYAYIKEAGLNELRTGMLRILIDAGADISIDRLGKRCNEEYGDITVKHSKLRAFNIDKSDLPSLLDEVPIMAVLACFAEGTSVFKGLAALKNKESDRLTEIYDSLKALGASVRLSGDTLEIDGKKPDVAGTITSSDHRIVMAMAVAGAAGAGCTLKNPAAVRISFPEFFDTLGIK